MFKDERVDLYGSKGSYGTQNTDGHLLINCDTQLYTYTETGVFQSKSHMHSAQTVIMNQERKGFYTRDNDNLFNLEVDILYYFTIIIISIII